MVLPGPSYLAPAKLNLFLHVVGRRDDGYHLLQSVFVLIDRCDEVRLALREDGRVARAGDLPGVPEDDDLAIRAARALQRATGTRLGADVEVAKRIPMGGGLGGGSSDAATVLLALNALWDTRLSRDELARIGVSLGADVPFFIGGRNAFVEGIGEVLRPIELPPSWYLVLVPPVGVPTPVAFAAPELTRDTEAIKMEDFSAHLQARRLRNDLEPVVAARYPEVASHLAWLARFGEARMTGSGGCVFAAFASRDAAQSAMDRLPAGMTGFIAQGLEQHPLREAVAAP